MGKRTVGELNVQVTASTAGLKSGLKDATRQTSAFAKRAESDLSRAGRTADPLRDLRRRSRQSGQGFVRSVRSTMKAADREVAGFTRSAARRFGSLGRTMARPIAGLGGMMRSALSPLAGPMVGAGLGVGLVALGGYSVKLAADLEQTRIAFKVLAGDAKVADRLIGDLRGFAAATPFTSDEVLGASRQLLAYGFTAREVVKTTKMLGDVSAGLQVPLNDMAYLFGTLRTNGRAYTVDIKQFAERGVPIWQELSEAMGVSTQQVRKLVEEGKVGFDKVETAFKNMTSEAGRFNSAMRDVLGATAGRLTTGDAGFLKSIRSAADLGHSAAKRSIEGRTLAPSAFTAAVRLSAEMPKAAKDKLKDELRNALSELDTRGVPVFEELARAAGKDVGRVRELSKAGRLSVVAMADALDAVSNKYGRFAGLLKEQSKSTLGLFSTLKDNALLLMTDFGGMVIKESGLNDVLRDSTTFLRSMRDDLGEIRPAVRIVSRGLLGIANVGFIAAKQTAAVFRVGLDIVRVGFPAAFRSASGGIQSFTDLLNNQSLSWAQAKANVWDFAEAAAGTLGYVADHLSAFGAGVAKHLVLPFMEARLEILRLRQNIPGMAVPTEVFVPTRDSIRRRFAELQGVVRGGWRRPEGTPFDREKFATSAAVLGSGLRRLRDDGRMPEAGRALELLERLKSETLKYEGAFVAQTSAAERSLAQVIAGDVLPRAGTTGWAYIDPFAEVKDGIKSVRAMANVAAGSNFQGEWQGAIKRMRAAVVEAERFRDALDNLTNARDLLGRSGILSPAASALRTVGGVGSVMRPAAPNSPALGLLQLLGKGGDLFGSMTPAGSRLAAAPPVAGGLGDLAGDGLAAPPRLDATSGNRLPPLALVNTQEGAEAAARWRAFGQPGGQGSQSVAERVESLRQVQIQQLQVAREVAASLAKFASPSRGGELP